MQSNQIPMLGAYDLINHWLECIKNKVPHASIRFGDASYAILAHETILTMDFIRKAYGWVDDPSYCGVTLPNPEAREQILNALRNADFVGFLYQTDHWYFKPLFDMICLYYDIRPKGYFYAFENYYLSKFQPFYEAFKDVRVLLVGAKAEQYREVLERRYGWRGIVGTVNCPNQSYVHQAISEMSNFDYDMALVCAGAPGKTLTLHAKRMGKVGIDFGSGADTAIQSDRDGKYAWEWDKFPVY